MRRYHGAPVARLLLIAAALWVVAAVVVSGVTGGRSAPVRRTVGRSRPRSSIQGTSVEAHRATSGRRVGRSHVSCCGGRRSRLEGSEAPPGFDARDPNDRHYNWQSFDTAVRTVVAAGLQPLVDLHDAPGWAREKTCAGEGAGKCRPTSAALADFATAAAERYRGGFRGLPRVRYWQVWNEPNLSIELMPQVADGKPSSPDIYRDMVNAVAKSVHGVHRDNVVVAGGLAPFGGDINDPSGGPVGGQDADPPDRLHARLLCMSAGAKPETDLRRQGRVRRLGAPPVHVRRADAQGVRSRRRLARRPRRR